MAEDTIVMFLDSHNSRQSPVLIPDRAEDMVVMFLFAQVSRRSPGLPVSGILTNAGTRSQGEEFNVNNNSDRAAEAETTAQYTTVTERINRWFSNVRTLIDATEASTTATG
jgi:hypothetical protein